MKPEQIEQEEKVIAAIRRLLAEARTKAVTGQGLVRLELHQGGIIKKELTLTWIDR